MPPHRILTNEIEESAALYALGVFSETDRSALDHHLEEGCSICQSEITRCAGLLALWAQETALSPPSSLRQKLFESIRGEPSAPANDPTPILINKAGLIAVRTTEMEWQPGPTPGLSVKVLFDDAENDMTTTLVRMSPGALYPSHRHKGVEEVYILQGELQVEGIELAEGDYCLSQPDSVHQGSYTKSGCLLVVKASKYDEIVR